MNREEAKALVLKLDSIEARMRSIEGAVTTIRMGLVRRYDLRREERGFVEGEDTGLRPMVTP